MKAEAISSGIDGLDEILHGLRLEDNVVWRVDDVETYAFYARALAERVLLEDRSLTYFRFGQHEPIIDDQPGIDVVKVSLEEGFEYFITHIHMAIRRRGLRAIYIFDCISDLGRTWYSDRMIGNFFKLTCPYLYRLKTLAYFGLFRNRHSYHAITPISETTQLLIDAYEFKGERYVLPAKVDGRTGDTMFSLHQYREGRFVPMADSLHTSQVLHASPWHGLRSATYRMVGIWDRTFMHAEEVCERLEKEDYSPEKAREVFLQIARLIISSDEPILKLLEKYCSLRDLINIWTRMIGTGMIGGKATGMLLARAILEKDSAHWHEALEPHDSFYIGSDVYYTFLVENDCWAEHQRQKDPETFLDGNNEVRQRLITGEFPQYILERFRDLLDYFGQSPIIVRSSSLLEDNFGNAFAGKYESVFCPNQGTREERMRMLVDAVRLVYASTMSDAALKYRKKRGVLDRDEQMALLIQRVSGQKCGQYFLPQLAGVSFSFNPYVWTPEIEPEAGMVRLVFGLGTRAVERNDDDYTRVIALNVPEKRPDSSTEEMRSHCQRRVDLLNLRENSLASLHARDILPVCSDMPLSDFTEKERITNMGGRDAVYDQFISFRPLLKNSSLLADLQSMLAIVRKAYDRHVDIEFTANMNDEGKYLINLVQCRPLQIKIADATVQSLPQLDDKQVIIRSGGGVIGHSRHQQIDRLIYVVPEEYAELKESRRYELARIIGRIAHGLHSKEKDIMLVGPGRWGTSTPALGVPVSFADIDTVTVLCEIDVMHEGLIPDLSLGTHFFNEMVEMDMLYIALFHEREGSCFNTGFLNSAPNQLDQLFPELGKWNSLIRVIDTEKIPDKDRLYLYANSVEQQAVLYTGHPAIQG